MAATSSISKDVAPGMHLKAMFDRGQPKLGRNRFPIPFHKRRADFKNPIAVQTDNLGLLGFVVMVGHVEFQVLADVNLPEETTLRHDGESAVNGGAGDGFIDRSSAVEQI